MVHDSGSIDPVPEVAGEGPEFPLHADEGLSVGACAVDLEPIPDDARVLAKLFEPLVTKPSDLGRIEVCKGTTLSVAAIENRRPGQASLGTFERQHLKDVSVVVRWDAPFVIVVLAHSRRAVGPRTPACSHRRLSADPRHVRVALTSRRLNRSQTSELLAGQFDPGRGGVLLQARNTLGARDRHDVVALRE